MSDQARADEFLRRQVVLTWVAALVVLVTLSGVALALFLRTWAMAAAIAGVVVLAVLFVVLLRHAVRVAGFAFRKELSR